MESRTLEINVVSASDLNDVNLLTKMDVYVVVSLSGDAHRRQKAKTPVDHEGGKNPSWSFSMKFVVDELAAKQNRLTLVFTLRCERALGDKDIGQVHVPVTELLGSTGDGKSMQHVSYQVRTPSGKAQGVLNFSYKFGEKSATGVSPVVAPVAGTSSVPYASAPYPPPPAEVYPNPSKFNSYSPPEAYPQVAPLPPAGTGQTYYPPPALSYSGQAMPYDYAPQQPPPPLPYAYRYPPQPVYGYPPPPLPYAYGYPPQPVYGYPPVYGRVQRLSATGTSAATAEEKQSWVGVGSWLRDAWRALDRRSSLRWIRLRL